MNYNDNFNYGTRNISARKQIEPYLQSDENVIWCDSPSRGLPITEKGAVGIFSVFWLGFAVFWTVTATAAAGPFGLFGVPFLIIGIYLVYETFFGFDKRLKKTAYAITDRRVLIVSVTRKGESCKTYMLDSIGDISIRTVKGNIGTITLGNDHPYTVDRSRYYSGGRYRSYRGMYGSCDCAFYMINDVQRVYKILTEQISFASDRNRK